MSPKSKGTFNRNNDGFVRNNNIFKNKQTKGQLRSQGQTDQHYLFGGWLIYNCKFN